MSYETNLITIAPVAGGDAVEFDLSDFDDGDDLMTSITDEVMANSSNPGGDWMIVDSDGFVAEWLAAGKEMSLPVLVYLQQALDHFRADDQRTAFKAWLLHAAYNPDMSTVAKGYENDVLVSVGSDEEDIVSDSYADTIDKYKGSEIEVLLNSVDWSQIVNNWRAEQAGTFVAYEGKTYWFE
jgi:hypothetical protein